MLAGATLELVRLVLKDGFAASAGGCILLNIAAMLTASATTFTNCVAATSSLDGGGGVGGAVYARQGAKVVLAAGSSVSDSHAGFRGGG